MNVSGGSAVTVTSAPTTTVTGSVNVGTVTTMPTTTVTGTVNSVVKGTDYRGTARAVEWMDLDRER